MKRMVFALALVVTLLFASAAFGVVPVDTMEVINHVDAVTTAMMTLEVNASSTLDLYYNPSTAGVFGVTTQTVTGAKMVFRVVVAEV